VLENSSCLVDKADNSVAGCGELDLLFRTFVPVSHTMLYKIDIYKDRVELVDSPP
jgi:hypothetical protein